MDQDAALVSFRAPGFCVSSDSVTQTISPSFRTLWERHQGLVSLHILAVGTPHIESKSEDYQRSMLVPRPLKEDADTWLSRSKVDEELWLCFVLNYSNIISYQITHQDLHSFILKIIPQETWGCMSVTPALGSRSMEMRHSF